RQRPDASSSLSTQTRTVFADRAGVQGNHSTRTGANFIWLHLPPCQDRAPAVPGTYSRVCVDRWMEMKSCKSVLISQCHGHGASSVRCWPSVINLRGASTESELTLDSDQEREPGFYGSYI
ncbi:hypothetical protein INR49_000310, partial [Caranx melampygus]